MNIDTALLSRCATHSPAALVRDLPPRILDLPLSLLSASRLHTLLYNPFCRQFHVHNRKYSLRVVRIFPVSLVSSLSREADM
jgi:hypothetical protein